MQLWGGGSGKLTGLHQQLCDTTYTFCRLTRQGFPSAVAVAVGVVVVRLLHLPRTDRQHYWTLQGLVKVVLMSLGKQRGVVLHAQSCVMDSVHMTELGLSPAAAMYLLQVLQEAEEAGVYLETPVWNALLMCAGEAVHRG